MRDDNCIFCKLANGDIPTNTVFEDEDFRVILDAAPESKGHALRQMFLDVMDIIWFRIMGRLQDRLFSTSICI